MKELQYVNENALRFVPPTEAKKLYPDAASLEGRWVNHNEGDSSIPKVKCRFVATDAKRDPNLAFYLSTPPREAIRLLASQMAKKTNRTWQATCAVIL